MPRGVGPFLAVAAVAALVAATALRLLAYGLLLICSLVLMG